MKEKLTTNQHRYNKLHLKQPKQSVKYIEWSQFVVSIVKAIMKEKIDQNDNKIVINTNLKLGLPIENINKVAGPFIEAWAYQVFLEKFKEKKYKLVNVEAGQRLNMADILLQFKRSETEEVIIGNIDVKSTSQDIDSSGKSPNITSFARIRSAYIKDPNFIFIILSLKHKVYTTQNKKELLLNGIMEIVDYNVYDLKHISSSDISYNPALGSGQLQIKDIHYVEEEKHSTAKFCKMLDYKFLASKKGFDEWYSYAIKNKWIKENE